MSLAVMQPYLFPYIGYFQLIYSARIFLIYDDVSFIKQGYINRNSILSDGFPVRFTIPVPGSSSNKRIVDLSFSSNVGKALKTINQAYSRAPYYEDVFPIVRRVLEFKERSIPSVCLEAFNLIFSYLGISKQFFRTSELEYQRDLPPEDRIIDLCRKFDEKTYVNPVGGRHLYSKEHFYNSGVELFFLQSNSVRYRQKKGGFVPNLSIIDCLMNCSPAEVTTLLNQYELV
ncbi:WbqC family protein [Marinobacter sp. M216]|uniref:WbqC family protein n=1 Tax=Marinobacter albus TaxID=3030833 RepID=A0ABT7HCE9_9GAMM|nr:MULTISPECIES: WbqC family protein [unclassified Marinobacter]MBW7470491.1 WbqC family protein [Marinobacter sp. F4218]MDK9557241.1 WbqC family protein [Marinobacter sp. M216]